MRPPPPEVLEEESAGAFPSNAAVSFQDHDTLREYWYIRVLQLHPPGHAESPQTFKVYGLTTVTIPEKVREFARFPLYTPMVLGIVIILQDTR